MHKSGFVNIIGHPNVGKSTLMNALVGERMSIITHKPQTTRHRIFGILSGDGFQIVFSDTPGYIQTPAYSMHRAMNRSVFSSFEDADMVLFVIDAADPKAHDNAFIKKIGALRVPKILILNKIDLTTQDVVIGQIEQWKALIDFNDVFAISAIDKFGTDGLRSYLIDHLPEGPVYFPKEQLSDRPERFFVSEIIREQILLQFREEIPYSCEVVIESFEERAHGQRTIVHIRALIHVGRKSQKAIILGKEGRAIRKLGTAARQRIEAFLNQSVFLDLYVKVKDNWRDDERMLKRFGYDR